jgi:hypothetical protein
VEIAVTHPRRWLDARRSRAAADVWIAHHPNATRSGSFGWRIDELISEGERRILARSLRHVIDSLSPARLPGAAPLNRPGLRPHASALTAIAARLDALDQPVAAAGVLRVHRLLTEPDSPLYARPLVDDGAEIRADSVGRELSAIRECLEVR